MSLEPMEWRRLGILCVAVTVVAMIAPSASPQVTEPPSDPSEEVPDTPSLVDLHVSDLQIVGEPRWVDGTPYNTTLRVAVTNEGPRDVRGYLLRYNWSKEGDSRPLNGDPEKSFDLSDSPLGPRETRSHEFPWRLQPDHRGAGMVRVVVEPVEQAERTPDDNQMEIPTFVPVHRVTLEIVGGESTITPFETRFFRIALENHGNTDREVELLYERSGDPASGALVAELERSRFLVPPGGSGRSDLFIDFPFHGVRDPFSASYHITAHLPHGTLTSTTPVLTSDYTAQGFPPGHAFETQFPFLPTVFVEASAAVSLPLQVTNQGNQSDVYEFASTHEQDEWTVEFIPSRIGLLPGEQKTVQLEVATPPAREGSPRSVPVQLQVRPVHLPDESWVRTLDLNFSGPNVVVERLQIMDAPVYTSETVEVRVGVGNHGDNPSLQDSILRLTSEQPHSGWRSESVHRFDPISAFSSLERTFPVPVPPEPGPARMVTQWIPGGQGDVASQKILHYTAEVLSFEVTAPAGGTGAPGEGVPYRVPPHAFLVQNLGTMDERVELVPAAGHGGVELEVPTVLVVPAGGSIHVPVIHFLPQPAGVLEHDNVTLLVRPESRPHLAWSASTNSTIVDGLAPHVTKWHMPATWSLNATLEFLVRVEDESGVDSVHVQTTTPDGSRHNQSLIRQSEEGSWWNRTLHFDVPGSHTLRVWAVDVRGNVAMGSNSTVRVLASPPAKITLVDPPAGGVVHRNDTVRVQVLDSVPIRRVEVTALPLGASEPVRIDHAFAEDMVLFQLDAIQETVPVRVEVRVVNEVGVEAAQWFDFQVKVADPALDATVEDDVLEKPAPDATIPGLDGLLFVAFLGVLARGVRRR